MKLRLRWKIFKICRAARSVVRDRGVKCWVWWFGAYDIDPRCLVIVMAVPTDKERDDLKAQEELLSEFSDILKRVSWPEKARAHVSFDIESEETVQKEVKGDWWLYYKMH